MTERDAKAQLWRTLPDDMSPAAMKAELPLMRTAGQLFAARYSSAHDIIKVLRAELDKLKPRPKMERTAL